MVEIQRICCLKCGKPLNAATAIVGGEKSPKKGDVSICVFCADVAIFCDEKGGIREATAEEWEEIERLGILKLANRLMEQKHKAGVGVR